MKNDNTQVVQSLNRGLEIIELLAEARLPVTLNEMAAKLDVNKSTAFRLAKTLESKGYIENAPGSKAFILGTTIWNLQKQFDWNSYLVDISSAILDELVKNTEETTHLAVRTGINAHFIAQRTPNQALSVSGRSGESVPLYASAHGKALLADHDLSDLKEIYFNQKLKRYTKNTITDLIKLSAECRRIQKQGYATDEIELYEDIRCIAVQIRDINGAIIASIGISAPAMRLASRKTFEKCLSEILESAKKIESKLQLNREKSSTQLK